jgi:hypothetical protein
LLKIIKWRDTVQDPSWEPHEEVDCLVVETVGWEVHRSEDTVKLGGTRDEEGNVSGIIAIPLGCVVECRTIPGF